MVAEETELTRLMSKINTSALATRTSHLREGIACSVPILQYDRPKTHTFIGGMDYHVDVRFKDGVKGIARMRRFNSFSPPHILRGYIVKSEVETMQFLPPGCLALPSRTQATMLGLAIY